MGVSQADIAAGKVRGCSHERRRFPRHDVPWNVVECMKVTGEKKEVFLGAMVNYSESGLCLNTMRRLREGQEVTIRCDVRELAHRAVVRWSKEVTKFFYRTGLEFLDSHSVTHLADSTGPLR